MRDYLLGLITLPVLAGLGFALFMAWIWVTETLRERWGLTFEAKMRDTSRISDYVLRNNIWWERSFGPVFVGGWYREDPKYDAPSHAFATRWVGLGSANGACVMVLRKRDLGLVLSPGSRSGGDTNA